MRTAPKFVAPSADIVRGPWELLKKLDQWMAATGYGADHPWRSSIAATVALDAADKSGAEHFQAGVSIDTIDSVDVYLKQARSICHLLSVSDGIDFDGQQVAWCARDLLDRVQELLEPLQSGCGKGGAA